MKILIADDEPISRRLLQSALTRMGHDVVPVGTGTEAISALLAADAPQLAILDWMMPDLDGLEVCRIVRERAASYVYLVLLTAKARREDMLAGLEAGFDDFLTKPFDALELQIRLRSGERVLDLQSNLLRTQQALQIQASHDHLTGLWNRSMVLEQLDREIRRARRGRGPLTVAIADIDHFKSINDGYGHAAGDAVLKQAAEGMKASLRDCDFIGRYGGEEFLFVLPGCEGADAAMVADRVRMHLAAAPLLAEQALLPVTVSIGVASLSAATLSPEALVNAADEALYRAKKLGRNRVISAEATPRTSTDVSRLVAGRAASIASSAHA